MNHALGGGRLEGRKLVRLVYIDEAGISSPAQEPYVVVAGVIVHADHQLQPLEEAFSKLVKKHIPAEARDGFIFHAKDLFNGGGFFTRERWSLDLRLKIADEIAAIPKKLHLKVAAHASHRESALIDYKIPVNFSNREKSLAVLAATFLGCNTHVEMWMRKHAKTEICMLVVEDNPDARRIITRVQRLYQDPKFVPTEGGKEFFPFKKIKESPLFQKKQDSSSLQMADFIAYVFKRWRMEQMAIPGRWWRYIQPMAECFAVFTEKRRK
jgi:hypothetical protein